jgi:hypothetical protein
MLIAALIETEALLKVIVASLAGVVGITLAFSLAITGAAGFDESRRDGRVASAGVFALLTLLALAACVAAVVFGRIVMTTKD